LNGLEIRQKDVNAFITLQPDENNVKNV